MSIIHVNQIAGKIKPLFDDKIDKKDIPAHDPELETKVLTRCLAAYAIYNHTACSADQAAMSIVDGGDDNGIDAIYYSSTLKELIIVQSKWIKSGNGEPDSGEIIKFCSGIEDLINLDFDRFNSKVIHRQAEITSAISAFDTKYIIILAYTGDKGLAEHGMRRIDDLVDKLNDAGEGSVEELVKFKKLDQAKIYTSLSKGLLSDPLNFEIGLHQWGKYSEPYNAFFGYLSGVEISKLWNENGRKLFHKNIRNVLGKTEVNDELSSTILNNPEKFWYFNNGITIIADTIEKSMIGGANHDLGSFKLTNASVVNGAQTISTIGETANKTPEKLKAIFVLVKCISLQNSPVEFGNEVTKANNRQNRIENRDFVSQDSEQLRLREEVAHDGFNYNLVRSDQFIKSATSFDVEEATICLACASGNVSLTVQAKREVGKFYENLSKGIYKQIFNPNVSGRKVANTIFLNRKIEQTIEDKLKQMPKKTGKEVGILVHGNRMISMLIFKKLRISETTLMNVDDQDIEKYFNDIFLKIADSINTKFSDNILATLFKNKTKCEQLEKLCA